jgi:hypothetical protein
MSTLNQAMPFTQHNPYLEDATNMPNTSAYYQSQTTFGAPQPVGLVPPPLAMI